MSLFTPLADKPSQRMRSEHYRSVASNQDLLQQRLVLWHWRGVYRSVSPNAYSFTRHGLMSMHRIVEINTGVICSCAPSVATFFRHNPISASSIFSLKRLRAKLSKQQSSTDGFDRVGSTNDKDIRLETQILASSAKAEGKFIKAKDLGWQGSQIHSTSSI